MISATQKIPYTKIWIASDHAGLELKSHLIGRFPFLPWDDLGPGSTESVDYPDYAKKLCERMIPGDRSTCGILICGSGQGMAIRANRFAYIRAALCWNDEVTVLSRQHNDANVLCLGARTTTKETNERLLSLFLQTPFEGGRHQKRVDKLSC